MPKRSATPWLLLSTLLLLCPPALLSAGDTKADPKPETATDEEPAAAEKKPESLTIAQIKVSGSYPEAATSSDPFGAVTETLASFLKRFEKAAADENVHAILLDIDGPSIGLAKVHEIRQAIAKYRQSGKEVHAYMESTSTPGYMIATACDSVTMAESGTWMVLGLRAEVMFYKNLFDKVGIKPDMIRIGEFKSAAEPYTRESMSPEFRAELTEVIDDSWNVLRTTIAQGRELSVDDVTAAIDNAPLTAQNAKKRGLLDRLAYRDQMLEEVFEPRAEKIEIASNYGKQKVDTDFSGLTGMVKLMNAMMGVEPRTRGNSSPKVAVIYATGAIMEGKSTADFLMGDVLGSDTLVAAIKKANDDKTVKAIVLRVDSPGGSALASDLIWRATQTVDKPFVASMGSTAASGGYYISMGADHIFAEPTTITGSIGVVGGKVPFGGVLEKVGVTTDVISRGKNSGLMSPTKGFSDSERKAMLEMMEQTYKDFVSKAAEGRDMEFDTLEKLARGRIYSGKAAKKLGLIDELGTLDQAIAKALELAEMQPNADIERLELPKPVSPLEALFGPLGASAGPATALPAELAILKQLDVDTGWKQFVRPMLQLLKGDRQMLMLPFYLDVR